MSLGVGAGFPSLLPTTFRLCNLEEHCTGHRGFSHHPPNSLHHICTIQKTSGLNELPRWQSRVNPHNVSGDPLQVDSRVELEAWSLEDSKKEVLLSSEGLDDRCTKGPSALWNADAVESVASQPSDQSEEIRKLDEERNRLEELSRRVDFEVDGDSGKKVWGWRALAAEAEPMPEQVVRPFEKRQNRSRPRNSKERDGVSTPLSVVSGFGRQIVEEWTASDKDPSVLSFTGTEIGGGSDVTTAGPLSPGGVYQRLTINLDLQLHRARCLRQKGLFDQATALLRQCIRDWPDDGRPYVALGNLFKKLGKVQSARRVFEDGCQALRGENAYIWQTWAVLEESCGNSGKARKLFDAATVADKKHAAAWHGWAMLELREGNLKRARELLSKGLKVCDPNEYILQTLALIELKAGRLEEARSLFGKAIQVNSKSAASWLAWALMESDQDFSTTARRLFQRGIEGSPKNRYVWQAWALFEAKQGNKERARQLFHRGQELNPKDPVLLQALGLFEYDCRRPGIARELFKRAVAMDPKHQPVWVAWGWMEWREGNLSTARELFQRAVSVDSRSMDAVRAFQAWGILEDRAGNAGVARVLFRCALKVDSQNVPAWMSWAAMEERQGNAVRADELRNLCFQQRMEVVDDGTWNVSISDILAPAIDRIKGFFKLEQKDRAPAFSAASEGGIAMESTRGEDFQAGEEEFDVEAFLKAKFPWKYG